MSAASPKPAVALAIAAAAVGAGVLLPAACLFPSYTFDLPAGGGAGGTSPSSSSSTSSSSGTTSSTESMSTSSSASSSGLGGGGSGGTGTTSSTSSTGSTSTSSSSSSSGDPCDTVDCSNPNCQTTHSCVAGAPAGWTGHFALYDGPGSGDPGCGADYPTSAFLGNNQLTAPQAACSACTCTAPQGQTCQVDGQVYPDMINFPNHITALTVLDAACNGTAHCGSLTPVPAGWNGSCFGSTYSPADTNCGTTGDCNTTTGSGQCNLSVSASALKVAGGTCNASTQTPTLPPVAWGGAGEACGGAPAITTGCNAGQTCLPKPQTPFQKGVCIMKSGDNTCPPGQFSQKHTFYAGASDTRNCSGCSCDPAAGATCSATIKVYTGSCASMGTQIATLNVTTAAGACANLAGNPQVQARTATFSAVTGGACPATGGQPTGTATPDPTTATTFCCIP